MKKIYLLTASCLLVASQGNSQIIPAANPDLNIAGQVINTGIAIAPFYQFQAMAYDDPSLSGYRIDWYDNTGILLDQDNQPGYNPDVAYYSNADALVVAYENGGQIFVDDYYLNTLIPVDYFINANNWVSSGTNPNVDMNSRGNGVLTWEDGGTVFACTFNIGTFAAGPVVGIAPGTNPDIVLLDDDREVIITYEQGGALLIESYDHATLMAGGALLNVSNMIPPSGGGWALPRIAAQRNSGFGPPNDYTVVAQEDMGGSLYNVGGFFFNSSFFFTPQLVNLDVSNCPNLAPKPVVAYDRMYVDVAWAQKYAGSCAPSVGAASGTDVLMATCDNVGNNVNGPTTYLQVNLNPFYFLESATSINTEYDGNYFITNANYIEGILFNDPGDLFWKKRDAGLPNFKIGDSELTSPIVVIKSPDSDEIKVTFEESELNDVATFVLVDNTGREITLSKATKEGGSYFLNANGLSEGIYLLNCTIGSETTTARIPHFKQ